MKLLLKRKIREWITGKPHGTNQNDWAAYLRKIRRNSQDPSLTSEELYEMELPFYLQHLEETSKSTIYKKFEDNIVKLVNKEISIFKLGLDLNDTEDLEKFKEAILKYGDNKVFFKYGGKRYTLNSRNITALLASIKGEENVNISSSDASAGDYIKSGEDVELESVNNIVNEISSGLNLIDTDTDDEEDNLAPQGSWFNHFLNEDMPLDLTRYDIHKSSNTENLKENCLLKALRAYKNIKQDVLTKCKFLFKNRSIPEKDLIKLCKIIKFNIRIKKIDNKKKEFSAHRFKIVNKEWETITICNINNHYFIDEDLDLKKNKITKYALDNIDKCIEYDNWTTISGFTNYTNSNGEEKTTPQRKEDKIITNSGLLVLNVWRNREKCMNKRLLNNELLDSQFWDSTEEFETLIYDPELNTKLNDERRIFKFEEFDNIKPIATYVADFETISAEELPPIGKNGIRVYNRASAKKKIKQHKPYAFCYGRLQHDLSCKNNIDNDKKVRYILHADSIKEISYKDKNGRQKAIFNALDDMCRSVCNIAGHDLSRRSKERVRLIFHNAGYDVRFIRPYLADFKAIAKGNKLVSASGIYKYNGEINGKRARVGVKIEIVDSYGIIPVGLGRFGGEKGLFPTIPQEKEILPYSFYSMENCEGNTPFELSLDKIEKYEELYEKEARLQFLNNCKKWKLINNGKINMLLYSLKYCKLDVKVLNDGLLQFVESIKIISGDNPYDYEPIDATDYVSLPQLVFDILLMKGCFDGTYTISGVPQQFIQKCVVGGRCMLKNNEKQYYNERVVDGLLESVQDYDSVSCYTSGFVRMKGLLKGIPKPIVGSNYEKMFLEECKTSNTILNNRFDAYFVKIRITKVGKYRAFPVASAYRNGIRDWSNNLEEAVIYCDNLSLDDFIEFQKIEFDILEGYYFEDGFNPTIVKVMRQLFTQRLLAKNEIQILDENGKVVKVLNNWLDPEEEGLANKIPVYIQKKIQQVKAEYPENYTVKKYKNSIEQVYKLLLNSCYGKMLLKEIETEDEYLKKEGQRLMSKKKIKRLGLDENVKHFEKYSPFLQALKRHYNKIREWEDCGDEVRVVYWKSINDHHNNVHQGVQVLSYAKRLMNEVICLAEDIGVEVLYTDTDSIHIIDKHIPRLEEAFRVKYNRELRGEDLNQFNEDFDTSLSKCRSSTFIGLAKKCYIDILKGFNREGIEETEYHIRMKSIPNNSILREANRRSITPDELYKLLWNDSKISYDLMKKANNTIKCRFVFNNDWTITNETNFHRSICFNPEKKSLIDNIITGKKLGFDKKGELKGFWADTVEYDSNYKMVNYTKFSRKFEEWKEYNKVVLNLVSEVSQVN